MLQNKTNIFNLANLTSFIAFTLMVVSFVTIKNLLFFSIFLMFIAVILDFLDGFLARKYNQVTDLGKIFDSINDLIIYIIYPIIFLIYYLNVMDFGIYLSLSIFMFSGTYRLIRQTHLNLRENTFEYYVGLPVCFSLFLLPAIYFLNKNSSRVSSILFFLATCIFSALMMSKFKFIKPKFKK